MKIQISKFMTAVAGVAMLTSVTACSSDYLDTAPQNKPGSETIFATTENAAMAVNGICLAMIQQYGVGTTESSGTQGMNGEGKLIADKNFSWKLKDILPKSLVAGENAGVLTEEGAKKLDVSGKLKAGIPMCPPEGDAGTGMVCTNSISLRTGNVSAGTSIFGMVVLEHDMKAPHDEIDVVTTPTGLPVAMAHCNNCTSDLNAWVNIFKEFAESFGMDVDMNKLYETLYTKTLEGDKDCGGLLSYNYFSVVPTKHYRNRLLLQNNSTISLQFQVLKTLLSKL